MRGLTRVAAVAAAIGMAGLAPSITWAQATAPAVQAFMDANAGLKAALASADADGREPPRLTDADTLVRRAYDTAAISAVDQDSLPALLGLCTTASETMVGYMQFGLARKGAAPKDDPKAAAQLLARVEKANIVRYENELALAMRFGINCVAAALPSAARFAASLPPEQFTPTRKEGLGKVQNGMTNLYLGVISMAVGKELSAENRGMLIDESVRTAPVMTPHLTLARRKAVLDAVGQALAQPGLSPEVQAKLRKVQAEMSRTDCTSLCALAGPSG